MYTKILAQGAKFGFGATVWTTLLYTIINLSFDCSYAVVAHENMTFKY